MFPFSAFVQRKAWATVALASLLSPAIGMLYLGRGRLGLLYFLVEMTYAVFIMLVQHMDILGLPNWPNQPDQFLARLPITLIGAIHCYRISKSLEAPVPRAWFARWYSLLAIFVLLPLLSRTVLYEPFNIPSQGMLPNLQVGDHLFVSKSAYGVLGTSLLGDLPERGDIAVFRKPTDPRINYIRRIVGLPGDRIQIIGGRLYINDRAVQRERLGEGIYVSPSRGEVAVKAYREMLPNGRHYLIYEEDDGQFLDNTPPYVVPEGHLFALGDNRDNAQDSRVLHEVGYIPVENLVGRLSVIYWNSVRRKVTFLE